jgi:hypothetical protein
VKGGTIIAEVNGKEMTFAVNRVHLEDDAGMLKHFSSFAGVDYNRAGCPLIEIVSEPCIHAPEEAVAYALAIKAILQYIDASDCNMEEGSLRVDTNISVRRKGEKGFRNKIEIKNMNSFSFMEMAIKSEVHRQIEEYLNKPGVPPENVIAQATYRWDPEKKETVLMRMTTAIFQNPISFPSCSQRPTSKKCAARSPNSPCSGNAATSKSWAFPIIRRLLSRVKKPWLITLKRLSNIVPMAATLPIGFWLNSQDA